jgi:ribose 5-phosphate isomerase RpiB
MKSGRIKEKVSTSGSREMMRIGIATEFGWYELKRKLITALKAVGYELADIGAYELVAGENQPDFIVPLPKLVSDGNDKQNRKGSENGIEACAEVNKIPGVCAAIVTGPTDISRKAGGDDLYVRCLGGQIKGYALSRKKRMTFLNADRPTTIPSNQLLAKVRVLGREFNISESKIHLA